MGHMMFTNTSNWTVYEVNKNTWDAHRQDNGHEYNTILAFDIDYILFVIVVNETGICDCWEGFKEECAEQHNACK